MRCSTRFYRVDHSLTVPISKFFPELSRQERRQRIEEGLQTVGLRPEETLGRYPHQLSGGQRQRIMVARALLLDPRVIVADEPVSMVDASLRATILETLSGIHRERGISLVYITHDLTTAYQLSHTILVMYQGAVVEVGDVEQVIKAPKHPYTQLLVSSIPLPDAKRRWGEGSVEVAPSGPTRRWCRPMPVALRLAISTRTPVRAAACYLYEDAAVLSEEQVAGLSYGSKP